MTATIRLIRVSDGKELWSHRFSSPAARLFSLPDDIYRAVANEIGTPAVFKTRYQPPAGAYEAYVKGRYDFSRRMASDLARAESSFRTALTIDPNYAAAWAGLSDALGFQGKGEEARIANERALELDDSLAEAHANLALGTLLWHSTRRTRKRITGMRTTSWRPATSIVLSRRSKPLDAPIRRRSSFRRISETFFFAPADTMRRSLNCER